MNNSMIFYEFFVNMKILTKKRALKIGSFFDLQFNYCGPSVCFVDTSISRKIVSPNFISANFFSFLICKASIFTPCFLKSPENSFNSIIIYFETDCLRDFARQFVTFYLLISLDKKVMICSKKVKAFSDFFVYHM